MTHARTDLEYSYEPIGFYEAPLSLDMDMGHLVADAGKAVVTLPTMTAPLERADAERISASVVAIFRAKQTLTHQPFKLAGPNVIHYRPDGLRNIVMFAEPAKFKFTGFPVDLRVTAPDGTIVRDTRLERLAQQESFMQMLAAKIPRSAPLRAMLESYERAVADPANELIHLYEIRDAAAKIYGGDKQAMKQLGVAEDDWRYLGALANHEPIDEGRHRGRLLEGRRPATDDELDRVRAIARQVIESVARAA